MMRIKFLLSAALMVVCSFSYAQNDLLQTLKVSSEWDRNDNLVYSAEKPFPGTVSLLVKFEDVKNFRIPENVFVIRSSGPFLTLRPIDKEGRSSCQISYSWNYGNVRAKVDTEHTYLLPYPAERSGRCIFTYNIRDSLFRNKEKVEKHKDFFSVRFLLEEGDTVYAARKGVVIKTIDGQSVDKSLAGKVSYSSNENYITVEHGDGTCAQYSCLKEGSIAVELGDMVYPGTPLALAGTFDGESYYVDFSVFSLELDDNRFVRRYYKPVFSTDKGVIRMEHGKYYKPVITRELITGEMTKREKKKFTE